MSFRKPTPSRPVRRLRHRNKRKRVAPDKVVRFEKPKSELPLLPALIAVAALTAIGVGGVYLYHTSPDPETNGRVVKLAGPDVFECRVSSITDGDTLRCSDGTRVRLNAVAARETDGTCSTGHPCPAASAQMATDKLADLASGHILQCRQTGTTYGRKAAICINEDNVEINCAMVQSGTALIWPEYAQANPICVY